MTGQGTRSLRLWPSRAAVGFCCESVLLQRSPNSSASSLLTSSKLEPGRGEGKRAESLCRDDVLALRGKLSLKIIRWQVLIQSQGKTLSGQVGKGWLRGDEQQEELQS